MAVTNFIPKLWSARLLENLQKQHVYANLVNRDYEGEIKQYGDTVHITDVGAVTVSDYVRNTNISDPQELTTNERLLVIDQQKYFNFQIDDVDKAQIRTSIMDEAMKNAGYGLADITDKFVAGMYVDVQAGNAIGSDAAPVVITKDNAYPNLIALKTILDKNNVPKLGRWVVLPSEYEGFLLQDDRFVKAGVEANLDMLRNGYIGKAAGFDIYTSNNTPNTANAKYKIIASYPGVYSYAEQVIETEAYRMEKRFADAVKGLHVYGGKTTRPSAMAVLTANFS